MPIDRPIAESRLAAILSLYGRNAAVFAAIVPRTEAIVHALTLSELHPDAVTTAYGPLADLVAIANGERV
jgi:hypothetical protein